MNKQEDEKRYIVYRGQKSKQVIARTDDGEAAKWCSKINPNSRIYDTQKGEVVYRASTLCM